MTNKNQFLKFAIKMNKALVVKIVETFIILSSGVQAFLLNTS